MTRFNVSAISIKALAAAARFPPIPYKDRDGDACKDRADDY